jgi:hypothetical protein
MSDLSPRVDVPSTAIRIVAKTALASVPGFGPLIAAIIDEVLPIIRAERLQTFAEELNGRVLGLEPAVLNERVRDPLRFGLVEDGLWQAARASSRERAACIAQIVANGLTSEQAQLEDRRYLLRLLDELNDIEVLELCAWGRTSIKSREEFYERHKEALHYEPACFGDSQEVIDRSTVRENYDEHLTRLGLLEEQYHQPNNQAVKLDRFGKPAGIRKQLSSLGRFLLREIGQPSEYD